MIDPWIVLASFCIYVGLLFSIALWVERRAAFGRSPANNAIVYSLSLAVYCTAWTYYGSVGKAATSGMLFLPIYLGPTISILLWWTVLRKLTRLKTVHRITSIADFLSARYNKSQLVAAIATVIAIVGIMPYIALQLKAIISTFLLITVPHADAPAMNSLRIPELESYVGTTAVVLMIAFTIMLGVRRLDPTERHDGMMAALAVECVVKLAAFLAAGVFVTYFMYDGFLDILQRINASNYPNLVRSWYLGPPPYATWVSYLLLSMSAILFLPRQFHVAVIENCDEKHILTAMWLFPLYMLLINVFVLPIAMAGLVAGYPMEAADSFVLMLPLHHGEAWLSLLVFIGGVSAAAGMIMVSSITLATMITNHLLLPVMGWAPWLGGLKRRLLYCRWAAVAGLIVTGYWFEESIIKDYMLVNIGLISFSAVLQFAPPILGGLFWRKGNTSGAILGLCGGSLIWCYTQLVPSFVRNEWLPYSLLEKGLFGANFLRPEELLGLSGLDPISHTVVWSMLFNIGLYVFGSLYFEQGTEEQGIAEQFVGALHNGDRPLLTRPGEAYIDLPTKTAELYHLLCQYFPEPRADAVIEKCLEDIGIKGEKRISVSQLIELHGQVEKSLAGSIGAAAAYKAMHQGVVLTARESMDLSELYAEILSDLKVTPSELKVKIDYYQEREMLLMRQANELESKVNELEREVSERRRIQEALRTSEEMFRGLVETMNEGLELEDEKGAITYVNDKLCEMLGCPKDDIIGCSISKFLDEAQWKLIENRKCVGRSGEILEYEVTWAGRNGSNITTLVSTVPLFDAQGCYKGSFSVITDISHLKTLEREKGNLISMFAHDMRSSLTGIRGLGLRLLTKSSSLDDQKKEEYLRIINKEASKLESLVDDFLEFSRLETGRLKLNFRSVSLDAELLELFELYQPRASQRGLKLELQIDETLPIIDADVNRLRRVFTNLLDNALKFSKESGTVRIVAESSPQHLVVKVIDEGVGIDPKDIPFIFDIFHRTRGSEKREGYGIGLATVKAIAEGHGGKVRVESELGKGSTFSVFLPKVS